MYIKEQIEKSRLMETYIYCSNIGCMLLIQSTYNSLSTFFFVWKVSRPDPKRLMGLLNMIA